MNNRAGRSIVAAEVTGPALLEQALQLGTPALIVPVELVSTVQARGRMALVRHAASGVDVRVVEQAEVESVRSPDELRGALTRGVPIVSIDVAAVVDAALAPFAAVAAEPDPFSLAVPLGRQPLVLLSGMLGDASAWDAVAAGVSDLVLPWPVRIDLDDSVAELAESVLAQAPERFTLCGHSLGGIVALEIMRRAPERVTGLVLLAASARGPSDAQQSVWSGWRERTEQGGFADIAADLARSTLAADRRDDAELLKTNLRMADSIGPAGFLRQLSAQGTRADSIESLAKIEVPVLVISGTADETCPPHLQSEIADHCPQAHLVSVPGSGHMITLEHPDAVVDAFRQWFTDRFVADS